MNLPFVTRLVTMLCFSFCVSTAWAEPLEDAQRLVRGKNYEQALSVVEDGLKDDRNNENLLALKGYSLVKLERHKEAIKFYKRMIRRAPEDTKWTSNLITVYRWQGDTDSAIETAELMIRTFPENSEGYEILGDIYLQFARKNYQLGAKLAEGKNPSLNRKHYVAANFRKIAQNLQVNKKAAQ